MGAEGTGKGSSRDGSNTGPGTWLCGQGPSLGPQKCLGLL